MKKLFSFLLLMVVATEVGAQSIEGIYKGVDGIDLSIAISNDTLNVFRQKPNDQSEDQVLSLCTIEKSGNEFYKVTSIENLMMSARRDVKIAVEEADTHDFSDNCNIIFDLPNDTIDLLSVLVEAYNQKYHGIIRNGKCEIPITSKVIPKELSQRIDFFIYPKYYDDFNTDTSRQLSGGKFFNRSVKLPADIKTDCQGKPKSNIKITIPGIDRNFSLEYYIDGEYMKISHDGYIEWKNMIFKKANNLQPEILRS